MNIVKPKIRTKVGDILESTIMNDAYVEAHERLRSKQAQITRTVYEGIWTPLSADIWDMIWVDRYRK